ncbi:hypothetical protein PRZ48_000444 [Zasmidium cellare]|uniref:Uncharacterized protein n=1 Tax=Zasmidium cellare TaxID=395010 RepID=A0ABR0EZX9_ZASCE|nr:hypothetical protein PRZ48_000444 [Zasmidium cellare]
MEGRMHNGNGRGRSYVHPPIYTRQKIARGQFPLEKVSSDHEAEQARLEEGRQQNNVRFGNVTTQVVSSDSPISSAQSEKPRQECEDPIEDNVPLIEILRRRQANPPPSGKATVDDLRDINEQAFLNDRRRYPFRHIEQRLVEEKIRMDTESGQIVNYPNWQPQSAYPFSQANPPPRPQRCPSPPGVEYSGMIPLYEKEKDNSRPSNGPRQPVGGQPPAFVNRPPPRAEWYSPTLRSMQSATTENRPPTKEAQMEQSDPDYIFNAMPVDSHATSYESLDSDSTVYPKSDGTSTWVQED